MNSVELIEFEKKYAAQYYHPLPVVLVKGLGSMVWDKEGKRYLDCMSAYSAVSHGHCHPRLVAALTKQANLLTLTSRAYHTELLGLFLEKACQLTKMDGACPMNTGAEAVETAIKAARKWGYRVKGIEENKAEIIVCQNNFHGRTITIISASTESQYRDGFGPLTPGFVTIPFDDSDALASAITPNTCAFLVEPMQGEAGMILPKQGYLKACEKICRANNVLLICDEIQSGLGRTGTLLAAEHDDVVPDGVILGKSLGGGMLPVSLFLAKRAVIDLFKPGDHGSTFGGNPLACAIGIEALDILIDEDLINRSQRLGDYFLQGLQQITHPIIKEVRGKGLFIGIELVKGPIQARYIAERFMHAGILSKDTHGLVLRIAPPLVIERQEIDWALEVIRGVFSII